jgi:hypothetical protein
VSAVLVVALALGSAPALAQDNQGNVEGFAEVRAVGYLGVEGEQWSLVERFRPSFKAPLGERVTLSATVEAGLTQGRNNTDELQRTLENSSLAPLLDAAQCEWPEDDNTLFHTNDAGDYLFVDRLAVDWYHPKFDLRVGRQALQWGSAMFVNPTDPFPQVLLTEPWRARAGVNSARITVPVGDLHQVQAVVGTDDDFSAPRLAARGTLNWLETDWSLVGAWRQEADEALAGVDIKGTAGVGFWFEGALRMTDLSEEPELSEQIAVGLDYSFPVLQSLLVAGQYIRNGAGDDDADATSSLSGVSGPECVGGDLFGEAAEPDPFAPFLSGTDYGLLSVNLAATRDVGISTAWLQNLGDGSGLLLPSISYRAPAQIDVSLSAQIPVATWGHGEFKPADEDLLLAVPGASAPVDFSGLVPDASLFLWTRFNI